MSFDDKIGKQEQDQRTYENIAEARRVTIVDSTGSSNVEVKTIENGHICTDNTTVINLDANDTFEGVWQDTLNYNNLIIGIKSSHDSAVDGLCICWSSDGVTIHDRDTFTITANNGKVFTFAPARRYVKLIYTNGDTTTTSFDIQTIFKKGGVKGSSHRVQDAIVAEDDAELIKSVLTGEDPNGTFRNVGVQLSGALDVNLQDGQTSRRAEVESLGALKTITPVRLVGTPFNNGTKDPNFWTETTAGTGSVAQNGQITLSTGTTATSSAQYDSVRKARKVTGTSNQFRMVGRLVTVPQTDNVRRTGCYDDNNGYFFQYDGTTFGIGSRKSTVDTIVSNGNFNGNYGDTIYTTGTSLRKFVIEYTSVAAKFFIDNVLLHTITSPTDSIINSQDLPIRMENYNENANTTDNSFQIRFATILRLGEIYTNPTYKYISGGATTVLKYGSGNLHTVVNNDNAGSCIIYDGISAAGKIIASVDLIKVLGTQTFDVPFNDGLTIVTSGSAKLTVTYE